MMHFVHSFLLPTGFVEWIKGRWVCWSYKQYVQKRSLQRNGWKSFCEYESWCWNQTKKTFFDLSVRTFYD